MRIDGHTRIIAHIGYPTGSFRAPLIFNPYFASIGENVAVVPMGVPREAGAAALPVIFNFTNLIGALITMPHKVDVVGLLDETSVAVKVASSCNAVRRRGDGRLVGDMFDGEGFVRGIKRKGRRVTGDSALIVGAGGVGSAIAASLAGAGVARLALVDPDAGRREALAARLRTHFPKLTIETGSPDLAGFDLAVNATPLGMKPSDPLPLDVGLLAQQCFVGEVVLSQDITPLLAAARARGLAYQIGRDMLYEQIPVYLEFFDLPGTDADTLRRVSAHNFESA